MGFALMPFSTFQQKQQDKQQNNRNTQKSTPHAPTAKQQAQPVGPTFIIRDYWYLQAPRQIAGVSVPSVTEGVNAPPVLPLQPN
jgi:hypothetical protein